MADYDWMEKTGGGSRTSAYASKPKPKKKPRGRGNVAEMIRDKNRRTSDSTGAVSASARKGMKDSQVR